MLSMILDNFNHSPFGFPRLPGCIADEIFCFFGSPAPAGAAPRDQLSVNCSRGSDRNRWAISRAGSRLRAGNGTLGKSEVSGQTSEVLARMGGEKPRMTRSYAKGSGAEYRTA